MLRHCVTLGGAVRKIRRRPDRPGDARTDHHDMLGHGLIVYDALYAWCRL
jgi:hypothetical protein